VGAVGCRHRGMLRVVQFLLEPLGQPGAQRRFQTNLPHAIARSRGGEGNHFWTFCVWPKTVLYQGGPVIADRDLALVSNRFEKEWRNLARNAKKAAEEFLGYRYHSPNVPMSAIRRYARQIVEQFQPDKIILFGSYAYGQPHEWSDVDILVDMPARNQIDQAI